MTGKEKCLSVTSKPVLGSYGLGFHRYFCSRPARGGDGKIPRDQSAQRGPEISVKCSYINCLSSVISSGTGACVHKSSFCPGARSWVSPALFLLCRKETKGLSEKMEDILRSFFKIWKFLLMTFCCCL
jgi:hypothetical protein